MNRIPSLILLLCIVGDLSLLYVLKTSPTSAYFGHLLLTCEFFLLLAVTKSFRGRRGVTTFIAVTFLLCLLAPFVGFLLIGAMLRKLKYGEKDDENELNFLVGNPMREASHESCPSTNGISAPLIESLGREDFDRIVEQVAFLKGDYSAPATGLLKRIRDRSNAMASLYANAALSVRSIHNERIVSEAADLYQSKGDSLETCYNLGSACQIHATSGSIDENEKQQTLLTAINQFGKYPEDEASIIEIIECVIELGDVGMANRWLEYFETNHSESAVAVEMRQRVLAAEGDWKSLQQSFVNEGAADSNYSNFWKNPTSK